LQSPSPSAKAHKRTIKSFVLRQGRLTKSQQHAIDTLWEEYGVDMGVELIDWNAEFKQSLPLVLEIGFGMGHSLVQQAKNEPDKNFIGIEVHKPGVGTCLKEIEAAGLQNLKLMNGDAMLALEHMLPNNCLDRVQLYFPDPWHKKKHNKRRIVNANFVELIHAKLSNQGCLHMATDWQPYAEHMLEVMQQAENFKNLSKDNGYCPAPDFRPTTKFETRGRKLGHGVWDLMYTKL
jgi:tRNA (guanine-N7-)-methyltransferase